MYTGSYNVVYTYKSKHCTLFKLESRLDTHVAVEVWDSIKWRTLAVFMVHITNTALLFAYNHDEMVYMNHVTSLGPVVKTALSLFSVFFFDQLFCDRLIALENLNPLIWGVSVTKTVLLLLTFSKPSLNCFNFCTLRFSFQSALFYLNSRYPFASHHLHFYTATLLSKNDIILPLTFSQPYPSFVLTSVS